MGLRIRSLRIKQGSNYALRCWGKGGWPHLVPLVEVRLRRAERKLILQVNCFRFCPEAAVHGASHLAQLGGERRFRAGVHCAPLRTCAPLSDDMARTDI